MILLEKKNITDNVSNKADNFGCQLCMEGDAAAWKTVSEVSESALLFLLQSAVSVFLPHLPTVSDWAELSDKHIQKQSQEFEEEVFRQDSLFTESR